MSAIHGMSPSGLQVPHGRDFPAGRFGRMFPDLPARTPTGLPMAERFGLPGGLMDGGETTPAQENRKLPAGFTVLGPVGTRIVAETLIGLLDADPGSYRSAYPAWRPTLANGSGEFTIADLLRLAGAAGD